MTWIAMFALTVAGFSLIFGLCAMFAKLLLWIEDQRGFPTAFAVFALVMFGGGGAIIATVATSMATA